MRSKRPGRLEGYWFRETRHCRAANVSPIVFGVGASTTYIHARRNSSTATFNIDGIDAGIWVDVAAAVTYMAARNQFSACLATLPFYGAPASSPKIG
jgi:hypothetical protein